MNVQMQNALKSVSVFLVALGAISVPVDLPGGVYVAIVFVLCGAGGYALAHYLADPTTATADIASFTGAIAAAINAAKTASNTQSSVPVQAPVKIDSAALAADITRMATELIEKYQAAATRPT